MNTLTVPLAGRGQNLTNSPPPLSGADFGTRGEFVKNSRVTVRFRTPDPPPSAGAGGELAPGVWHSITLALTKVASEYTYGGGWIQLRCGVNTLKVLGEYA